jgi:hypothetical protein
MVKEGGTVSNNCSLSHILNSNTSWNSTAKSRYQMISQSTSLLTSILLQEQLQKTHQEACWEIYAYELDNTVVDVEGKLECPIYQV